MENYVYFCRKFNSSPIFMRFYWFAACCLWFLVLASCSQKGNQEAETSAKPDSILKPKYASGFVIEYYRNYKAVVVFNPWKKGVVQAKYYIVERKGVLTPDKQKTIEAPVHFMAATSATHYAFIAALNELPSVKGISSPQLVYNSDLIHRCKIGQTIDLGDAFSLNVEKAMALHLQALMMSSYNQADAAAERIVRSGIPVVFNNEWMETSPLGRAEWIKFVAAFYNKEKVADTVFNRVERGYLAMKVLARKAKNFPDVMIGGSFKGTWYVPSGKGFMGNLLADANVRYCFTSDTTTGSIPVNFEQALQHFMNARIWLNCDAKSLKGLLQSDARYGLFRAYKQKQVYSLNNRINASGGNDFWEAGVLHPDLILSDFIRIVHPELLPGYQLFYMTKLE
ncbi:MAG: periplasmic binding protein [Bacteroidetes bacterium]|nr:periplasmic binding protein [Bacteroidota bacterium]